MGRHRRRSGDRFGASGLAGGAGVASGRRVRLAGISPAGRRRPRPARHRRFRAGHGPPAAPPRAAARRHAHLRRPGHGPAAPRRDPGRRDRSAAAGGGQPDRPGARPARPARPPAGSRAGRHRRSHRGGDVPGPGEPDQCRRQAPARRRDGPRRQPVRRLRAREPGLRHDPGGGRRPAAAHHAAPGRWAGDRGGRRRARARGRGGAALRRGRGDRPPAPGA